MVCAGVEFMDLTQSDEFYPGPDQTGLTAWLKATFTVTAVGLYE